MTLKLTDYSDVVRGGYGEQIYQAVLDGMWPFRVKRVDIWADYDIDYHEYRIVAAAVLMSGYTLNFVHRIGAWDLSGYPEREMSKAADAILKAFRNREERLLTWNIILGDN